MFEMEVRRESNSAKQDAQTTFTALQNIAKNAILEKNFTHMTET